MSGALRNIKFKFFVKAILLFICAVSFSDVSFSQKIKFSGYGSAGFAVYDRLYINDANREAYYRGKLQADIDFGKLIEAQLDMRGESSDNYMRLQEFSLKIKFSDFFSLKAGNIKKPFGYEQMIDREDLPTIERSYIREKISELGYGGRNIGIMAYGKNSPEMPVSYHASLTTDNSSAYRATARFAYHIGGSAFGANYQFQKTGAETYFLSNGAGADFSYADDKYINYIELYCVQDPVEGLRRKLINESTDKTVEENIYVIGAKFTAAYNIPILMEYLKEIRPVALFGYYSPNADVGGSHVFQVLTGADMFMNENVSIRLNIDLRLSKHKFNTQYSTKESRIILEIMAKF